MIALVAALLLAAPAAPPTKAPDIAAAEASDIVLRALRDEMARVRSLKMDRGETPYFVESSVDDIEWSDVWASFGAVTYRSADLTRSIRVGTRVGSPALDNTNFGPARPMFGWPAPRENNYDALRESLWLAYDRSYKDSLETLAHKQAWMKSNDVPDRPDDFGPAELTNVVLPAAKLVTDIGRWTRLVKQASTLFRDRAFILTGDASYRARAGTQWAVNSESLVQRYGATWVQFTLSATAQAPDGMTVESHWEAIGRTDADLPKDDVFLKAARDASTRLDALTKAPVIPDDYNGPVLFTGGAAAQFFLAAIGDPLSHPNNSVGAPPAGNLVDRIEKRIASPLLTVRDDPTQRDWHGTPLLGFDPIDDDGVVPQPITLVAAGVLKTYYMSRVPTAHVKTSNGHSHDGAGGPGNIFVETSQSLDRAAMKKRLLELVKDQGLAYGVWIEELNPSTSAGGNRFVPASEITLPRPRVTWRIFPDGREELARVAGFKPMSFRVLEDIDALGNDTAAVNIVTPQQLVSVVSPSVLVNHLEIFKPKSEFETRPLIPRPPVKP